LDCAVKYDIIKKSGAWYSYNEEKVGQGRDNAREYLEQHPDFTKELEAKLRAQIFPGREFPKPASAKPAQAPKVETAAKNAPAVNVEAETAAENAPAYEAPPAGTAAASPGRGRPKKAASSDD